MESETVELKSELTSDVCKEIAAFANSHGGTLYIGIRKETDSDSFEEMRSLEQELTFSTTEKSPRSGTSPLTGPECKCWAY